MFPERSSLRWRRLLAGLLAALGATTPACSGDAREPQRPSPTSAPEHDRPMASPPARLVSLHPSVTEIVLALGEADRLVARTDFDRDPRLAHLPSLGRSLSPTLESVLALDPDLVLLSSSETHGGRAAARLEKLGVPAAPTDLQSVQDVLDAIRHVGRLLGAPARGDSLATALRGDLARTRSRYRACAPVTVLYVLWPDPPRTAGPSTFVDEVIRAAGGRNLFHDSPARWPHASLEEVVRRDPDFVLLPREPRAASFDAASLSRMAGWRELSAVREGRVLVVDGDLFNRAGPRMAEAAQTLGAMIDAEARRSCRS